MILANLLLLTALSGASPESDPTPSLGMARAESHASRWDGAGWQFVAAAGGGGLGAAVGGATGLMVGSAMVGDGGDWSSLGMVIVGGLLGASLGGTTGTAFMAHWASPTAYPSRSRLPAWGGSAVGALGGALLVHAVAENSPEDVKWGFWPGFAAIVACSGVGAVVVDRVVASPASVAVAPWTPQGRPGLLARVRF